MPTICECTHMLQTEKMHVRKFACARMCKRASVCGRAHVQVRLRTRVKVYTHARAGQRM